MSVTKNTTVWCDDYDCNDWIGDVPMTADEVRSLPSAKGWTRKGGKDYCPEHSPVKKGTRGTE